MSYELSFAEDFFSGNECIPSGDDDIINCYSASSRPKSVLQSLVSLARLHKDDFFVLVNEVLSIDPFSLVYPYCDCIFSDLLDKIREYNTCDSLSSPIEVYLDENHSITVYE